MNDLTEIQKSTLPTLIDRAAGALTAARTSAEVLEARDQAQFAYDAAKVAGRMARAKKAHEAVIGAVYRAQADALLIEARAKMRLADEYDAAQERGEVAGHGRSKVEHDNVTTAADLGLRRDEIHEARKIRDAENADPGRTEKILSEIIKNGDEPTKAKLRRLIAPEGKAENQPDDDDATLKLRRIFRKMSPQGQEDDWVGIKLALRDEMAKSKGLRSENTKLKEQAKAYMSDDKNAVIRAMEKKNEHLNSRVYQEGSKFEAEKKKNYALNKRLKELEKCVTDLEQRLESQEIVL